MHLTVAEGWQVVVLGDVIASIARERGISAVVDLGAGHVRSASGDGH